MNGANGFSLHHSRSVRVRIGTAAVRIPDRPPPTTPGMRVHTRRFGKLRACEAQHASRSASRKHWPKQALIRDCVCAACHHRFTAQPPDRHRFALVTRASRFMAPLPARQCFLSGSCSSARGWYTLHTVGHPSAVVLLHFTHSDQLVEGLPPAWVRPCRAHQKKGSPRRAFARASFYPMSGCRLTGQDTACRNPRPHR